LAFFDSDISPDVKRAMVTAIEERPGMDGPQKRAHIDTNKCNGLAIQDFVTKNTRSFFGLGLSTEFLE